MRSRCVGEERFATLDPNNIYELVYCMKIIAYCGIGDATSAHSEISYESLPTTNESYYHLYTMYILDKYIKIYSYRNVGGHKPRSHNQRETRA
jgi:hypothetical protein